MNREIIDLLKAALECSVFISPTDPGLTYAEILKVGESAGYLPGEIGDAARHVGEGRHGSRKLFPDNTSLMSWAFYFPEEPEYRNFDAFDFVVNELNLRVRTDGARNAQIGRAIVVERAIATGMPIHDVELAITYQVLAGQLIENDGVLRFAQNGVVRDLPSKTLAQLRQSRTMRKNDRARAYPIVRDIIERRTDGRPQSIEPLDAFAEQLDRLKYGAFRLWWIQTAAELRRSDPLLAPVSTLVLAAALVEGALTFVVKHARNLTLGVFRSKDFDGNPRTWKIDNLVASAASGGETAILDLQSKNRAESLIRSRQRIHAGRMLSDFPGGVPDIRPEEARDARATADIVVRKVIDWLQKYPPS